MSKESEEFWTEHQKILVTLSTSNVEKLDKIAKKHALSRSAVLNLFLNNLTGEETIKLMDSL